MNLDVAVPSVADGRLANWIAAARCGDAEALGRAFESFRAYLLLVANQELDRDLKTKFGGSDLVQETFLHVQNDIEAFRGRSEEEWRHWLRGILVHRLANHRRHYKATIKRNLEREVRLVETPRREWPTENRSPSKSMAALELEATILDAVSRLSVHYRDVLLWRHRQHLSFEEVGSRLDVSPEAARKLCERALKALSQELKTLHDPS